MRFYTVAGAWFVGFAAATAHSTSVVYDATKVSGDEWQLSYKVANNSLSAPIAELTIYFNPALFSNLAVGSTQPTAWNNPIAVPSDPAFLPDISGYAFFDTVASNNGIAVGSSLSGFTALVDYSGSGSPTSQIFQIVNPATFTTIDQGSTTPSGGVSAPEPSTISLLVIGLLGTLRSRRRRSALT